MRAILLAALVIGMVCVSCTERQLPGVPFERSTAWRPVERAVVEQREAPFKLGDGPAYRAVWTNGGLRLHYCLMGNGIRSISAPWPLVVFSEDGRIVDENVVVSAAYFEPKQLLSISPLKVGFGYTNQIALAETNGPAYTPQEWRVQTQSVRAAYLEALAKRDAGLGTNPIPVR